MENCFANAEHLQSRNLAINCCCWGSYPQCSSKAVFEVGSYAHQQRLPAGDHGHAGSQVPHHVVSGHAHPRLLGIQGKVLPDDLLTGGHGDLDGSVHHGMDEVLHGALDRLPHTLLQLRVGLEQRDLQGVGKGQRMESHHRNPTYPRHLHFLNDL